MEKVLLRGRGLLRRPLYPACARRGALSVPQQRLQFSCSPNFSDKPEREARLVGKERFKLPDTPCRTRFAPSPTGYLHLGSLRTALFNYLVARATGGQFVLRIEDTDRTRLVPDAEEKLYEDLKWAGLSWDEGPDTHGPYGPYRQSERLPLYNEHADKLVHEGKAYRCFCSPAALEEHKRAAHESGQSTLYPGTCRNISPDESGDRAASGQQFAIRFKSPETPTRIQDIVYSRFQKKDPEDDYIIMKRDGFPTYHFANVVDDRHMNITHVIRGAEWLISTPKHVDLYNAFGWEPPKFAHLGLLVDLNRQKLSKRDKSTNMSYYKNGLVLPDALLNFSALLGWRGKGPQGDVMNLQEMVDNMSLQFSKGDIMVSMPKLPHLQDKHLERLVREKKPTETSHYNSHFLDPFKTAIEKVELARKTGDVTAPGDIHVASLGEKLSAVRILEASFHNDLLRALLGVKFPMDDPASRFGAAVSNIKYHIWAIPETVLETSLQEAQLDPALSSVIAGIIEVLRRTEYESAWTREVLEKVLRELTSKSIVGSTTSIGEPKSVYKILRWALVASEQGLPLAATMDILGREETLRRFDAALRVARPNEATASEE